MHGSDVLYNKKMDGCIKMGGLLSLDMRKFQNKVTCKGLPTKGFFV